MIQNIKPKQYSAVILAVNHDYIKKLSLKVIKSYGIPGSIIFDLKGMFRPSEVDIIIINQIRFVPLKPLKVNRLINQTQCTMFSNI